MRLLSQRVIRIKIQYNCGPVSGPYFDPYRIFPDWAGLQTAGADTLHNFRRLPLGRRGHAGIGVQHDQYCVISWHTGRSFHTHPVLEDQSGKGVLQVDREL